MDTVLQKAGGTESIQRLSEIFKNDEATEKLGFSLLHRTVVGLNSLDLATLLKSISKASINEVDAQGRSPLWWAARRGDLPSMTLLIEANADVNKKSNEGQPPLDTAIRSRNEACAWLLLDIESIECAYTYPNGWTALDSCCAYGSSVILLERLLYKGAKNKINQPFEHGGTALHFAVAYGHNDLAKSLISHGIEFDTITRKGESPLSNAIEFQNIQALQLLLTHRANYRRLIHVDETLLHYAAIHADLGCLQTLRSFKLHGLDTHAKTTGYEEYPNNEKIKGRTAMEIAMEREDVTQEWRDIFGLLVNDIESPESFGSGGARCEESEVFEDALEVQ